MIGIAHAGDLSRRRSCAQRRTTAASSNELAYGSHGLWQRQAVICLQEKKLGFYAVSNIPETRAWYLNSKFTIVVTYLGLGMKLMEQRIDLNKFINGHFAHGKRAPIFIDAFAGCGGLSLGLMQAGWQGLFAIEKDKFAFETLKANFLSDDVRHNYDWPEWLPQAPITIDDLMGMYGDQLDRLRGKVDLLAGGPPCQGFSSAGRRDSNDPRNKLVEAYFELVEHLEPDMVLLENVRGITYDFSGDNEGNDATNYSVNLVETLTKDYDVFTRILKASSFGVPQKRPRFFLIALRKGVERSYPSPNPFSYISNQRKSFFKKKGLPAVTTSRAAISDLTVQRNGVQDCAESKGFQEISYVKPKTVFQKLMRKDFEDAPSNTRLARHQDHIVERFTTIIDYCKSEGRLNVAIPKELRERFGLKKQAIRVLDPLKPAPTITSMPDDLLHYAEPRTLTVRENARLQTFPDWFIFKGKYTTGGDRRRREVPRFTQVANAVPPLLAELFGQSLMQYLPTNGFGQNETLQAAE